MSSDNNVTQQSERGRTRRLSTPKQHDGQATGIVETGRSRPHIVGHHRSGFPRSKSQIPNQSKSDENVDRRRGTSAHPEGSDNFLDLVSLIPNIPGPPSVQKTSMSAGMIHPQRTTHRPTSKSFDSKPGTPMSARPRSASQSGRPAYVSQVSMKQKRVFENQFSSKKIRYGALQKDINEKISNAYHVYDEMVQLREKILSVGGNDPGAPEQPLSPALPGSASSESSSSSISDLLKDFHDRLYKILAVSHEFSGELLDKIAELADCIASYEWDNSDFEAVKRYFKGQTELMKQENEKLQDSLSQVQNLQSGMAHELIMRIKGFAQQLQLTQRSRFVEPAKGSELNNELKAEKEKNVKLRTKVKELEKHSEEKAEALQERIRFLENQLKQKEFNLNAKEFNKNHISAVTKVEKEKKTLEAKLAKLKEETTSQERQLSKVIDNLENKIDFVEKKLNQETEEKEKLLDEYNDLQQKYSILEEKSTELCNLADRRKEYLQDDVHSDNEIVLFNKLKKANDIITEKEDYIFKLESDKKELITAIKNNSDREEVSYLKAELMKKNDRLDEMEGEYIELQEEYKKATKRSEIIEKQLIDVRNKLQSQLSEGGKNTYQVQVLQLQQEIYELQRNLQDSQDLNKDLEKNFQQKQMQLENYKTNISDQIKILRARHDVQKLIDPKTYSMGGSYEYQNDAISNEEMEKLYLALEDKSLQIAKLENVISQMEKHEESGQSQRLRLERRIAKLEAAASKNHKESKSGRLFFF